MRLIPFDFEKKAFWVNKSLSNTHRIFSGYSSKLINYSKVCYSSRIESVLLFF